MSGAATLSGNNATTSIFVDMRMAANVPLPKPSLKDIERNYQVAEEKSQDWSPKLYGAVPIGTIGGQRSLTLTEGKMLDKLTVERGILGLRTFQRIHDGAIGASKVYSPPASVLPAHILKRIEIMVAKYPATQRETIRLAVSNDMLKSWKMNDGHTDAFRHAYWNTRLTAEFGAEWTKQFATAHEGNNPSSSTREAMDLYNNEVGRKIAVANPNASPPELADLVKKALNDGELIVLDRGGNLAWSSQVAVGHHGISISLDKVPARINTPDGNASAQ